MAYPTLGLTIMKLPYMPVPAPIPEPVIPPEPLPDEPTREGGSVRIDAIETLCAPGYVLTAAGTCVREEMLPNGLPGLPEPYVPPTEEQLCPPGTRYMLKTGGGHVCMPIVEPEPMEPTLPVEPEPVLPVEPAAVDGKKILPLVLAAAGFLFLR